MYLVNFFKQNNSIFHNNYNLTDSLSTGSAGRRGNKGVCGGRRLGSDGPESQGPWSVCPPGPGGDLASPGVTLSGEGRYLPSLPSS